LSCRNIQRCYDSATKERGKNAKTVKAIRAEDNDSNSTKFEYEYLSQQKTEYVWPP